VAAQRNEHLVVIMLEPQAPDEEFEIWPMHVTIVPWFPCDDSDRLDEVLSKVAGRHQGLEAKIGTTEDWGRRDRFKVIKIEDQGNQLHRLHRDVFRSLEKAGFPIHQKDYLGDKYMPHITLRNSLADESRFQRGEIIKVERFTLVSQVRLKGSGRMIKKLVKDYELG
jgi:2'-5' RNA ligase